MHKPLLVAVAICLATIIVGAVVATVLSPSHEPGEPDTPQTMWTPADEPATLGDYRLSIHGAEISLVKLVDPVREIETVTTEPWLKIWVRVVNTSETRKGEYLGWMARNADDTGWEVEVTLTDNLGNPYKRIPFETGLQVEGATLASAMYPGQSIEDCIVFEVPVQAPGVRYLRLTLAGEALEYDTPLRFEIPMDALDAPADAYDESAVDASPFNQADGR